MPQTHPAPAAITLALQPSALLALGLIERARREWRALLASLVTLPAPCHCDSRRCNCDRGQPMKLTEPCQMCGSMSWCGRPCRHAPSTHNDTGLSVRPPAARKIPKADARKHAPSDQQPPTSARSAVCPHCGYDWPKWRASAVARQNKSRGRRK